VHIAVIGPSLGPSAVDVGHFLNSRGRQCVYYSNGSKFVVVVVVVCMCLFVVCCALCCALCLALLDLPGLFPLKVLSVNDTLFRKPLIR